jgi:hypothetical protein
LEIEIKNLNNEKLFDYEIHIKKYQSYKILKSIALTAISSDTLILEIDYCQNKPLPKLPLNKQFYLRLLWFILFNVYFNNSKKSFIFLSVNLNVGQILFVVF